MSIAEAVRELRSHTGKSQQRLATELEMSISTLQHIEYGDTPSIQHLLRLWAVAVTAERADLAAVIHDEIQAQLVAPPGFRIEFRISKVGAPAGSRLGFQWCAMDLSGAAGLNPGDVRAISKLTGAAKRKGRRQEVK